MLGSDLVDDREPSRVNLVIPELPKVGARLGRFRLDAVLGKGGAGVVYKAFDETLETALCLKVIHPAVASHPEMLARFKRELLLARRVTHPGVCRLFDLHEEGGNRFLTMEYVEGKVLTDLFRGDNPLEVGRTLLLGERIARALAAAHAVGVVHRDLKPGNIIVREGDEPCVLDFGIATALDVTNVTRPGVPLGTRQYIAPEVWRGDKATHLADLYALGIIIFNCLTAKQPFSSRDTDTLLDMVKSPSRPSVSALRSDVASEVDALVQRCMALEPAERPPSADALAEELARVRQALPPPERTVVDVRAPGGARSALSAPKTQETLFGDATTPEVRALDSALTTPSASGASVIERGAPSVDASSSDSITQDRSWVVGGRAEPSLAVSSVTGGASLDEKPLPALVTAPRMAPRATTTRGRRAAALVVLALVVGPATVAWLVTRPEPSSSREARAGVAADGPPAVEPTAAPAPPVVEPKPPDSAPATALDETASEPAPPAATTTTTTTAADPKPPLPKVASTTPKRARAERASAKPASRETEGQAQWEAARAALSQAEARRGVIAGDVPALDALAGEMRALEKRGDLVGAAKKADAARALAEAVRVDDGFVRAKLARFNARFDEAPPGSAKDQAGALMGSVLGHLGAGRHERANEVLNQAFRKLRGRD